MYASYVSPIQTSCLEATLTPDTLHFARLPPFLRVLLVTDGTVTRSLQVYFGQPIQVEVLSHSDIRSELSYPKIDVEVGDQILRRRVRLRGATTGEIYCFAESVIVTARLCEKVRDKLIEEKKGIGELLLESRQETYREILAIRAEKAGEWAHHLGVGHSAGVVIRNYVICLAGLPAILIEEVFPELPFHRR